MVSNTELTENYIQEVLRHDFYRMELNSFCDEAPQLQVVCVGPLVLGDDGYKERWLLLTDGVYYMKAVYHCPVECEDNFEANLIIQLHVVQIFRDGSYPYISFELYRVIHQPDQPIGNYVLLHMCKALS